MNRVSQGDRAAQREHVVLRADGAPRHQARRLGPRDGPEVLHEIVSSLCFRAYRFPSESGVMRARRLQIEGDNRGRRVLRLRDETLGGAGVQGADPEQLVAIRDWTPHHRAVFRIRPLS